MFSVEMREGETRGGGVAFEKSFLHKEICLFCREEMSVDDATGCSQRIEVGLAYCQRTGQGYGVRAYLSDRVVSDLERKRPIWFGGKDRTQESLDMLYEWLGQFVGLIKTTVFLTLCLFHFNLNACFFLHLLQVLPSALPFCNLFS